MTRWCPKCGFSVGVRFIESAPGVPVWVICPDCGPVLHEEPDNE